MPSARATIERTAGVGQARHEARRGARASPPRRAAPGRAPGSCGGRRPSPAGARGAPGGRGSRSGSGRSRLHSSRWSMKSSVPGSAQWRSSKTRTTGAASRHPLEERPPGAEELAGAAGRARRRRRAGASSARSTRRARASSGHEARDASRRASSRVVAWSSVSRRPRARPDHLAERPERDALAVRGRAALVPPDVLDDAVDVLQELPGEAALADAAPGR